MTKEEAVLFVLKALKSPMMMTSKPTREEIFKAAEDHQITATDLLNKLHELIWNV
jgi:preprotein translocase subunit Sss1